MDIKLRKFEWNPLRTAATLLATGVLALALAGVGGDWAARQTDRFVEETLAEYGGYPGVEEAMAAGEGIELQLPGAVEPSPEVTVNWGGLQVKVDPGLQVYSDSEGILPWYIEQETGRVFSADGGLITGFIYDYDTGALVMAEGGAPVQGYNVAENEPGTITISLPGRRETYASFFALPSLLCAGIALAAGLALAMPRWLGIGRGFWGKLPLEWHAGTAMMALVGCVEVAGELSYTAVDGGLSNVLRTLFFLDTGESGRLAQLLVAGVFWLGAFCLFQAGASVGMGLRDGFKRYLLCRVWTVRFSAWLWRGVKALGRRLTAIRFDRPVDGTLAKLLAVNLAAMVACCAMWGLGVPAAVVYSAAAFLLLRRWLRRLQGQYTALRQGVSRMAAGDLKAPVPTLPEDSPLAPVARDLDAVRRGFGQAVAREVRSQNMKTELITNVSHDLKTPLTAIITYVDLLKDETLPVDQRRAYVDTLDRKSQRLKRLIDDLFEVSKAATGNVEFRREQVELGSLLRQIQFELGDQIQASGVEFRWQLPERRAPVVLDGQRTCRIFENLIVNITKYALPGTRAYIRLEQQGGDAVVTLKNVSAAELDFDPGEITERFVRGDKNRSTEGSGLGLAIARSFTELQGGTFAVETDGDLFKAAVSFPLAEES